MQQPPAAEPEPNAASPAVKSEGAAASKAAALTAAPQLVMSVAPAAAAPSPPLPPLPAAALVQGQAADWMPSGGIAYERDGNGLAALLQTLRSLLPAAGDAVSVPAFITDPQVLHCSGYKLALHDLALLSRLSYVHFDVTHDADCAA